MNISSNQSYYKTLASPEAFIAINKDRQKIHTDKVYLNEGTEFQLELFNPTQHPVLAKISLNGKLISQSGLVLKPAQRIFLDRFIDVAKKFKFETYEVEKSNETLEAIAQNGLVEVSFYKEVSKPIYNNLIPPYTITYGNNTGNYNPIRTFTTSGLNTPQGQAGSNNQFLSQDLRSTLGNNGSGTYSLTSSYCNAEDHMMGGVSLDVVNPVVGSQAINTIETGRIEAGSHSNTKFTAVAIDFESFPCTNVKYQLLPQSLKPVEVKDIKNFCQNCGSKVKNNWKFCPSCSQEL